ncbi:hypothetical protein ACFOYW_05360 [Gryllotalpicola reticulitermitis]|uniref:DUF8094 domain-containing protein n=1 Tax=Gryllotalpicola reticulitermitis TaxID=1184153 RepID=A0ABV8Q5X0_9MICO
MRFVIAIAAFLVAAVMIGVGVAQRTVWAPAPNITASADIRPSAPYVVISGTTLNANEGQQTLDVSGANAPFVAYGRTADVMAWIGSEPYERLSYDPATKSLTGKVLTGSPDSTPSPSASATPTPSATPGATSSPSASSSAGASASASAPAPNPNGSDLWLEQFTGAKAAKTTMNVPDGVSVIIATDGAHPAPKNVSVTWPMDTRTPWAGPLIVIGGLLAIAGIIFYVLAIRFLRRGRGPRRGGGRRARLPRQTRAGGGGGEVLAAGPDPRGRRAVGRGMIAVPVVLAGALTLAGCSSDYWPSVGQQQTSTPTATPITTQLPGDGAAGQPAPAVTEPQLRDIVDRVAATAKQADATGNATLAATRFTGAALTEREVNYKIRKAKPNYAATAAIPTDAKLSVSLPQATDSWPRTVNVIVSDASNAKAAPLDLVLTQATPRDNYKVAYSVTMLAGAKIPDVAPASIGASIVPPDSKLLSVPPSRLASDYASVLLSGAKSPSYKLFEESADGLAKQVGAAYKAQQQAMLVKKKAAAKLSFADKAGSDAPIAFATNNAGALVSTTVQEAQTIKPTDPAVQITLNETDGPTAALTGVTKTSKGLETDYSYQLLFYVPPVETGQQVQLLGFTQAVIGAREL